MIYSQWRPDGGYDYFETSEIAPLGNDLPVPVVHEIAGIGAPSTECGRPIPSGAHHAGSGAQARGVIAPMSGVRGTLGSITAVSPFMAFVAGAGFIGLVWYLDRKWR